jgi:hypothetical protein
MPPTLPVYLIHVPKTAGSAIKQTLKTLAATSEAFEGWKVTNRDGVVIHFIARGHCRVRDFPRPARGGPRPDLAPYDTFGAFFADKRFVRRA